MNLDNFINKYKSKYELEITLIKKFLHKTDEYDIFEIDIKNKEKQIYDILNEYTKPTNTSIQRFYYEDKYMEVNNNNLVVKKK